VSGRAAVVRAISAVPSTVPSSVATNVRPGGAFIHCRRAVASSVSVSHENVSPARMISRMNAHIAGQSSMLASRICIPGVWVDLTPVIHMRPAAMIRARNCCVRSSRGAVKI
jgi:hypothetical protein